MKNSVASLARLAQSMPNLNRTQVVVTAVEKSAKAKRPTDALKPVKTVLKDMGFTIGRMDAKTGEYPVEYEPVQVRGNGKGTPNATYTPATIQDMLRSYLTSIRSLNVKHNSIGGSKCPLATFKKRYGSMVEPELLERLTPELGLREMRLLIKDIKANTTNRVLLKALRDLKIENQAYYWIESCMYVVGKQVKNQQATSKKKASMNKILINPDFVLKFANDVLSNDKINDERLVVALMAATGRRTTEIIKTAKFTKYGNSKDIINFTGQLKQKDRVDLGRGAGQFLIPSLVDSDLVVKGLSRLRRAWDKKEFVFVDDLGKRVATTIGEKKYSDNIRHNEGIADTFIKPVATLAKKVFNSSEMRPVLLRSAYTEIAYEMGKQDAGETREAFRERVLGHVNDKSQANYSKFGLSPDVKTIGYESDLVKAEAGTGEVDKKLIALLKKTEAEVFGNTRAKALHNIHRYITELANKGLIKLEDVNATWLRKQIIDGKAVGRRSVMQFAEIHGLD